MFQFQDNTFCLTDSSRLKADDRDEGKRGIAFCVFLFFAAFAEDFFVRNLWSAFDANPELFQ